ncbi:ORC5 [Bugula neritina]|uniref:Origin recognition complex subunit 5 n=1 Tax=Bugula neritina TaxID=10212 RepID=A0A7J7JD70_BUGNE|nr:ORC5 [Bugula neritina]
MDSHVQCRYHQCAMLKSIITKVNTVPSIFVHGHTASGKTLCIKRVLDQQELPHVLIHCAEFYTQKLIYEHILTQLNRTNQPAGKCEDMNSFVRLLHQTLKHERYTNTTAYLVFERAEKLRSLPANVLPALLRLKELSQSQVCVILESEIPWENFRQFPTGYREPITLHFSPYSKDDLIEILSSLVPDDTDKDFYTNYCHLIVNVFFTITRNLRELKYLANMNFKKYCEPVNTGAVAATNHRALWKAIEPQLKTAINSIYLHEMSSSQWEKVQAEDEGAIKLTDCNLKQSVELPYFSKYLLIAAYLASYNPAKSDRKFFVKNCGRLRKQTLTKNPDKTSNQIIGPKQFQLDRLMAIFYSIVEGKVMPTTHLYTQISNLVSLQLLATVSGESQFDSPKYKCLATLEFIQSVSRTVEFQILHYLHDFN